MISSSETKPSGPDGRAWFLLGAVVLLGAVFRLCLHFGTPLVPGINGAYYMVQARAVAERGTLAVPDLPLTFFLQALVARVVEWAGGGTLEQAVMFAVKTTDSFLPPLTAVALAWMGWRWARRDDTAASPAIWLAPALLVACGAQGLQMTGDFQKNSLALVWLAALAPATHRFLAAPGGRTAWPVLGLVALTGLTHVGVLGAMLGLMGVISVVALVRAPVADRRRLFGWMAGGAVLLGAAGAVVFAWYDPSRVLRLLHALASPSDFLNSGGGMPAKLSGARAGGGGPGMPPGGGLMKWGPGVFLVVLAVTALVLAWRRRASLPSADFAVVCGAAVMTLALGGPFYDFDKGMRFLLIAAVPAAVTLSFLLAQMPAGRWRSGVAILLGVAGLLGAGLYAGHGRGPTISPAAADELREVAATLPADGRMLVVARHGLEWWAAWILHTHIAQPRAVKPEDWTKFDHVLYLVEKERSGFGPPMGGPQGGAQGGMRPGPRGGDGGPPPGGGMPGGLFEARAPEGSVAVHNGRFFRLSDAPRPAMANKAGSD